MALRVFATCEGIGSARHLERPCARDHAHLWLCGGGTVNRTMLAEFRVQHGNAVDGLLTQLLAVLMKNGLLELQRSRCIETVNADLRAHRGMQQLPARGITKVRALAMPYALTFNILRLPRARLGL